MNRVSSVMALFSFLAKLAKTLRATSNCHLRTFAIGNALMKTSAKPGRSSLIPRIPLLPSRLRLFKSLKNSRKLKANSLSSACSPSNIRPLSTATPIGERAGIFSPKPSAHQEESIPPTNRCLIGFSERSRPRQVSSGPASQVLTLCTLLVEIYRPMSLKMSLRSKTITCLSGCMNPWRPRRPGRKGSTGRNSQGASISIMRPWDGTAKPVSRPTDVWPTWVLNG